MAYIRKVKTGYRAEVVKRGVRRSQTFDTKAAATAWAVHEEKLIDEAAQGQLADHTLLEGISRYEKEVSVKKRGLGKERLRFAAFIREFPRLCSKVMHKITAAELAEWRDTRLKKVSADSVAREATQIRNVWTLAIREWGWLKESPWPRVKMPAASFARRRRTSPQELRAMLRSMGYVTRKAPTKTTQEVAWCYLLSHHTAMRAGEVRALTRERVNLATRVVRLDTHKTVEREGVRFVPITAKAARLMRVLDEAAERAGRDNYFKVSDKSLDALFRKARDKLLIDDLHFHDARADALTRMARRLDVMTLAKISGHRDLRQLLDAYYRETPEQIAARI